MGDAVLVIGGRGGSREGYITRVLSGCGPRSQIANPKFSCLLIFSFASSNYSVRSRQHIRWNREADLLRGFQVDHQFKLRRLLDW
jgi:hypothetical protein